MKHLKLVAKGIDVRPLLDEIEANSERCYVDTTRQEKIAVERETHAIALRCHADTAVGDSRVRRAKPVGYEGRPTPSMIRTRIEFISFSMSCLPIP